MSWKYYRSHKIVQAQRIISVENEGAAVPRLTLEDGSVYRPTELAMTTRARVGDFAVAYNDGYKSISPEDTFLEGYTEYEPESRG